MPETIIRNANLADYPDIAAVAVATGQDEEWAGAGPAYLDYLMDCGWVVVATSGGAGRAAPDDDQQPACVVLRGGEPLSMAPIVGRGGAGP